MSSSAVPTDPLCENAVARPLPAVDERLVAPGTRYQIRDGRVLYVAASDEPHGSRHSKLSAVLEAHTADDYDVASDMLTRLTEIDDIAPDVSVFPKARNAETGGRQLEELAFEVVNSQTLSEAARKAAKLVARGVRRVFATDARRDCAFEWDPGSNSWQPLDPAAMIEDRVFAVPLPIAAIVRTSRVDNVLAQALLNKQNALLLSALDARRDEGRAEGRADALLAVLVSRGLIASDSERQHIRSANAAQLERWLGSVATCRSVIELLRS